MAEQSHSLLDHVVDGPYLDLPLLGEVHLPNILGFQLTRFMVMETVAAILMIAIFIPLSRHVAARPVTRGRFLNAFDGLVSFIRDGVARPTIGEHDADRYLPFLWTTFFFVLFCNLLGLVPGGGSPTGSISVTVVLALLVLGTVIYTGSKAMGPVGFWLGLVPKMDLPGPLKLVLWPLMFVIEIAGLFIRHVVLSVRLFANMMAGHLVLAVILGFAVQVAGTALYVYAPVAAMSVLGSVALTLLELFVAFLQAFIFTFLAALFIGSASHAH